MSRACETYQNAAYTLVISRIFHEVKIRMQMGNGLGLALDFYLEFLGFNIFIRLKPDKGLVIQQGIGTPPKMIYINCRECLFS